MNAWSVPDAAKELGLSEQRVRALAQAGRLGARRVGHRWLLEEDPRQVQRFGPGRPLSAGSSWAILALLSGDSPDWIHPSARSRLRRRLKDAAWLEAALSRGDN